MNQQTNLNLITSTPEEWVIYLSNSLYRYKLRFEDNLSLYMARPDEKIFLPADLAADRFGYRIPLSAEVLIVPSGRTYYAATELELMGDSAGATIWDKVHNPDWLLKQLESDETDLLMHIEQAVIASIESHSQHQLFSNYTLSPQEQRDMYTALKNSAVYAVATRCGLDCGKYAATFVLFNDLEDFHNTTPSISSESLDNIYKSSLAADFCAVVYYAACDAFKPIDTVYKLQVEPTPETTTALINHQSTPVLSFSIPFSEYGLEFFPEGMSFAHANALLYALDSIYQAVPGYYKTDFVISIYGGSEDFTFNGRYDIGSEGVDLLGHIHAFIDVTNDDLPKEKAWSEESIASFFSVLESNTRETEEESNQIRQALASISINELIEDRDDVQELKQAFSPVPEEPAQKRYQLIEDTNIYFNHKAYTVVDIAPNGEVTVSQADMPLLRYAYPMTDLQALLREDPRNEYLLTTTAITSPSMVASAKSMTKKDIVLRAKLAELYLLSPIVVDAALRLGGNEPYSLERICAFFAKDYSADEKVQFLRKEYGINSKGFYLDNTEIALWFDQEGIYINEGKTAVGKNGVILPWETAAKRITELLELGEYVPQSVLDGADTIEKEAQAPDFLEQKRIPSLLNYRITDKEIGVGTLSERFKNNMAAIRTLKTLERETRPAQEPEQEILARYVGWGGLADCFDPHHAGYSELHKSLTEEEFISARASTLTAFYTPPVVMEAMYSAVTNMQLQITSILDPACGIGSFTGMLPDALRDAAFYGVELDSLSARIAKQLYPQARIVESGYEKTALAENSFDLAIGNVPFGSEGIIDKKYDKYNFLIHDYFFAKTVDMVRPGGIIAFVTSKGTMDKKSPKVRKYLAERADLLGAIRLPNNTFKSAAGTDVTSDILFLQKRAYQIAEMPEWVYINTSSDGIPMNEYFLSHPEMILGEMKMISSAYGFDSACIFRPGDNLADLLNEAIKCLSVPEKNIVASTSLDSLAPARKNALTDVTGIVTMPSDPRIKPYSYGLIDGTLYYRETISMSTLDIPENKKNRLLGILEIRDVLQELIDLQVDDYPESVIEEKRAQLNNVYDIFVGKYGYVSNRDNARLVAEDNAAPLVLSIEKADKNDTKLKQKSAIFFTRTIRPHVEVTHVDTAAEALMLSMAQHAHINMPYMEQLTNKTENELFADLKGVVFLNPMYVEGVKHLYKYLPADEYLSGNIREKLVEARAEAERSPEYADNVTALEAVMPKDLTASEITVSLGSTWVAPEYFEQFMYELFQTPTYAKMSIKLEFSEISSTWNISRKSQDFQNLKANNEYGIDEMNGYVILEASMNKLPATVTKVITTDEGKERRVINPEKTVLARSKQELIKEAFANWIWKEPERRRNLCALYNERFNSCRPREYDGSFVTLHGSNANIELYEHQRNAIARGLLGGNTLLAHAVGAGKTIEIAAIAQESKRLGLCTKSMIVVPKPLVQQWGMEYLSLYPNANILVASSEDFTAENRKRFCGRIAAGNYDAIILSHSQFEKIPMSAEWRTTFLEQQRDELLNFEYEAKQESGNHFSIKDAERSRKRIEKKLETLYSEDRKDDMITFEALGVDKFFVDEAHYFKNLGITTKLSHVSGISQTEAQKSSDMYMKCRYMDSITNEKGVVFATGTPISNSMVELYTMQKYLQYSALNKRGLLNFDAWASTFGEVVTASELAPEGTGYREKSRFAKFFNLPELIGMFKECADVRTVDTLNLIGMPIVHRNTVSLEPTEIQREYVASLADRAEAIRAGRVDSSLDNMLVVTNDGRKVALDQRLVSSDYPDDLNSKVSQAAENIYSIWAKTMAERSTQLAFCDLSTPSNTKALKLGDTTFSNVYSDLKLKLVAKGVPASEIAFIHSANTDEKKITLFEKVRNGNVRVLIGSTQKMGAGMNVQDKLISLHHLDCPWRPSDLEQREGRIARQGNSNDEVEIYSYVTKGTFDAYLYQLVEAKQRFISQIMTSKTPVRQAEDIDESVLTYAEIKALATGNPLIKEKMDLDIEVARLKLQSANYKSQQYELQDKLALQYPKEQAALTSRISAISKDVETEQASHPADNSFADITIAGHTYSDKKEGAEALFETAKRLREKDTHVPIGSYRGFDLTLYLDSLNNRIDTYIHGSLSYRVPLSDDSFGNLRRIDNCIDGLPKKLEYSQQDLSDLQTQIANANEILEKPFAKENEFKEKESRLAVVTALLLQSSHSDSQAEHNQDLDIDESTENNYER